MHNGGAFHRGPQYFLIAAPSPPPQASAQPAAFSASHSHLQAPAAAWRRKLSSRRTSSTRRSCPQIYRPCGTDRRTWPRNHARPNGTRANAASSAICRAAIHTGRPQGASCRAKIRRHQSASGNKPLPPVERHGLGLLHRRSWRSSMTARPSASV